MAEKRTPRVVPGPSFYKLEELGSYVDAETPVLDVSILVARLLRNAEIVKE
jgi:hypothetical protein